MAYGIKTLVGDCPRLPVANTAAVHVGDMLKWDGAGQYVTPATAGDIPCAVALEGCPIPTTDGDNFIAVNRNPASTFEYPADTGAVTLALRGTTMDTGGAQSINIDASTDDCIVVDDVNLATQTLIVRILFDLSNVGIV